MGAVHQFKKPTSGKTQCQKIIEHVNENGGITSWEAINNYGITRLAARVHELNGTKDALRPEDIGDGYVRYVPAWAKRMRVIRLDIELLTIGGTNGQIARNLPPLVVQYNNAYRQVLRAGVL